MSQSFFYNIEVRCFLSVIHKLCENYLKTCQLTLCFHKPRFISWTEHIILSVLLWSSWFLFFWPGTFWIWGSQFDFITYNNMCFLWFEPTYSLLLMTTKGHYVKFLFSLLVLMIIVDEVKQMSRKLSEMNTAKCEAIAKLDEVRSGEINKEVKKIIVPIFFH